MNQFEDDVHAPNSPRDGQADQDPVCGMRVDPHTAKFRADSQDHTHYFCSESCRTKFVADPQRYVTTTAGDAVPVPEGTIYTCPMHPQIRQVGPGTCPICGMALEPLLTSADSGPNPELRDMSRRFWVGLALAVPVVAFEMSAHVSWLHMQLGAGIATWVQAVLATPVVLWAGWPFFARAWRSLVTLSLNMFTLIAMGTGVAWLYSVVAILAPSLFPQAFHNADGGVAVYFEAAAVITVLVLLGQVLELRARERTSGAIAHSLTLRQNTLVACATTATTKRSIYPRSTWATAFGCARGRKFLSMERSSKAIPLSTHP